MHLFKIAAASHGSQSMRRLLLCNLTVPRVRFIDYIEFALVASHACQTGNVPTRRSMIDIVVIDLFQPQFYARLLLDDTP